MNVAALDEITEEALALDDGVDSFMRVDTWWRRWESNGRQFTFLPAQP